jgi:hypothetical protein
MCVRRSVPDTCNQRSVAERPTTVLFVTQVADHPLLVSPQMRQYRERRACGLIGIDSRLLQERNDLQWWR